MFNLPGMTAGWFLNLNRKRHPVGKAALVRRAQGGRPHRLIDAEMAVGRGMIDAGIIPVAALAERFDVSAQTFYTYFP